MIRYFLISSQLSGTLKQPVNMASDESQSKSNTTFSEEYFHYYFFYAISLGGPNSLFDLSYFVYRAKEWTEERDEVYFKK